MSTSTTSTATGPNIQPRQQEHTEITEPTPTTKKTAKLILIAPMPPLHQPSAILSGLDLATSNPLTRKQLTRTNHVSKNDLLIFDRESNRKPDRTDPDQNVVEVAKRSSQTRKLCNSHRKQPPKIKMIHTQPSSTKKS